MNKYKVISMIAAACIIAAGLAYLYVDKSVLQITLAVSSVCIGIMGIASVFEVRSRAERRIAEYIPAICFFVLSVAVFFAFVYVISLR